MNTYVAFSLALAGLASLAQAQSGVLLVGQEGDGVPMKTTSLASFPAVSYTDGENFFVQGAAATPDGLIYISDGYFVNDLYAMLPGQSPSRIARLSASGVYGLGYVGGKLYGFSNFGSPMGIYEIDTSTGACTLRMSTEAEGLRFFALDGNPADGLLYGFSEYGTTGLWSINPATWTMHHVAPTPPGSYGMCRGMAVGNNTVYMVDTHPTDTYYAYSLDQGDNGVYVPFENPYPDSRNGGGAWYDPSFTPPPPVNDNCADAIPVDEGSHAFSTFTATTDGGSSCGGYNDVWYRYTPTFSHYAMIGTCGAAGFDTIVALYDACGGTELACNDDNCDVQSNVGYSVTAGVPIVVRVAGWSPSDRGAGSLVIGECFGPTIQLQPVSATICVSSDPNSFVRFRSDATATGDVTYAWERNGVPLTDGPTGTGSAIYGTSAFSMIIIMPGVADAATYRCVVSSVCESTISVTSDEATLTVCAANFNCDGAVNSQDFFDFLNAFFSASPSADFNHDTIVNSQDFFDFLNAFFAGC